MNSAKYKADASSPTPLTHTATSQGKGGISSGTIVAIVVPISVAVLIFIVATCCWSKRTRNKHDSDPEDESAIDISHLDSQQYDFHTIEAATNSFSVDNMIGKGRFGEFYQGMLPDGQDIAVKRCSITKHSRRGVEKFKKEVEVNAKLKHRNLVRLLGFSIQDDEKILVFEYMPNISLDDILSDPEKQKQLDWTKRYKIIKGIARGIQYIHDESRLRIIHRDIKPPNILLDSDMNPKIIDFGLAKMFAFDQTQEDTDLEQNKVDTDDEAAGTMGYIAPEQVYNLGEFSIKSDVYSFGITVMQIISGRKPIPFYQTKDKEEHILSYAWRLWEDGEGMELLDPTIRESCNPNEVMRCIHIALLCVQCDPADRPSMSSIILMLASYSMTLPSPSDPLSFYHKLKEAEEDELSTPSMEDPYDRS